MPRQSANPQDTDPELFEPVDNRKVSDMVVEQIEDLIVQGVLRPGEKLPPERVLSEQLGVSRPKLREGIGRLVESGLLEVHQSDGTFVGALTGSALAPAMIELYSRRQNAFFDFLEYRREQESFAAHLAAQRSTDADKEGLRRLIEQMVEAHQANDSDLEAELDTNFHMAIIEAAHNSMLLHVMRSIYLLLNRGVFYNRFFLYNKVGVREKLLQQHQLIAQAIIDSDAERASAAAEGHLDFVERTFRNFNDESSREQVSRKRRLLRDRQGGTTGRRRRSA